MKKHIKFLGLLVIAAIQFSCSGDDNKDTTVAQPPADDTFIRGSDISYLPEMESIGTKFYNNGKAEDMLTTLKNAGCNIVRIRLWKNPVNGRSGMAEVKALAEKSRRAGLRVWLTVHYSDSWADPEKQVTPKEWEKLSFEDLKKAVTAYTEEIIREINPDIIQIGNEINSGLLFPTGHLMNNEQQCIALLTAASQAVRAKSSNAKIMIHYADIDGGKTDWFFNKMNSIDYDYIGLSYYPMHHGKNLSQITATINALGEKYGKKVVIAETSYPFTLLYNDFTNNNLGSSDQLVPGYPATPAGQKAFVLAVRASVAASTHGQGFAYWGGEWVAFRGKESAFGSTYENQALYSFDNNALSVMQAFAR
ncbi:arabinogalactan endo-beta-1,4-galactanase [Flavobacterium pectinovorum]|uniref:glycoside hydrolase family 53 protein n=1 Tax=Flavobacterium pectinovorum TaxID=29533 RepID=UPI001FAE6AAA|nr:glycosyl hydrolase 53 family protein [Flavobacterium pectinovorum]MCI9846213.1 glycosyl hydrolase 53 family protein [Flavobacterium pectinovorum]